MATRTIASPGVQITEQDLSIITRPIGATDILITGFAPQGPTEDLVNVTDISEFEQIYGAPTNSAERYLYHSAKQILNTSPGNLLVSRLPYGSNMGEGYVNSFSALIYPVTGFLDETTITPSYELSGSVVVTGADETALLNALESLGGTYSIYNTTTAEQDLDFYKSDIPAISTTQIINPVLSSLVVKSSNLELTSLYQNTLNLLQQPPFSTYPNQTQLENLFSTYSALSTEILEDEWFASLPISNTLFGVLTGRSSNDRFGTSLAANGNGNVVAVGEILRDTVNGNNSGSVRVFENLNGQWVQKGNEIPGRIADIQSGSSVSINNAGDIVAIGSPLDGNGRVRVYSFQNNDWVQLGLDSQLQGSQAATSFGQSISLDDSGTILAVGAPNFSSGGPLTTNGYVEVFQYNGTSWSRLGQTLIGEVHQERSGTSVFLSSNGQIVAIGAPGTASTSTGRSRVFSYNQSTSTWSKVGSDIIGELSGDFSGSTVCLNNLGDILAIGSPLSDVAPNVGRIRVYKNISSVWTKQGSDIVGIEVEGRLGTSISLDSSGTILAAGGPSTEPQNSLGSVDVFIFKNNGWQKIIFNSLISAGNSTSSLFGTSVSLNNAGTLLFVGAPADDTSASNAGMVRVIDLSYSREITVKPNTIEVTSWSMSVSTYSLSTVETTVSTPVQNLSAANRYEILSPVSILLTDENYNRLISNNVDWKNETSNDLSDISDFSNLGKSGIIIINNSKTSINNLFEGYYVGITDNSNINPATNFDSITGINTTTSVSAVSNDYSVQKLIRIPEERLNFKLTEDYAGFAGNSLSETLESFPTGYDFGTSAFDDSIIIGLFKIKTSIFNQDTITLDYRLIEGHSGSLYSRRTQNNPTFGNPNSFYIENIVDKRSNNLKVMVNPYISKVGNWTTNDGRPAKKVTISDQVKNLYPSGVYSSENDFRTKDLGNIPLKLQRVLNQIQNDDTINIDVVAEAGLGTVWVGARDLRSKNFSPEYIFDENEPVDISDLKDTSGGIVSSNILADYQSVANKFLQFVTDRKDHVFIADPIRYIFVNGKNFKTTQRKGTTNQTNYVFSTDIYWPLKNQFSGVQSSYVCTYGNWLRTNDDISDQFVWLPPSGYAAAVFASTAQIAFPWAAPAGLNRGVLTGVFDLGVVPNQKQSDLLYKINVNPISFFGSDGFAIFGQKTLYRKPSAFDRINVRRLFLTLEKEAKQLLKYFVFEPNTFTTRQRLIGALEPSFDKAKLNDGLYEYEIVCDERNNTPDVIDNNELKIAMYIKPVRTAEFILAEFIGTRTGVTFSELIQ